MEVAPFGVKVCTLEPGGIRTNWARRAGQNAPDLLPEYVASIGSTLQLLRSLEGRSEGDLRKIADLIVQLANSDEVPLRLILGVAPVTLFGQRPSFVLHSSGHRALRCLRVQFRSHEDPGALAEHRLL